jgi:hypothetical protein
LAAAAAPSTRGHGTHRECSGHLFRRPANDGGIIGFDDGINLLSRPVEGNHFRDNMTHKARAMSTHAGTTDDILRFHRRLFLWATPAHTWAKKATPAPTWATPAPTPRRLLLWATPAPIPIRRGPIARTKVVGVARLVAFLRVADPEGIL